MLWYLAFRARWALLGALLAGAALALYTMDPDTRQQAVGAALAWLGPRWLVILPWALCGALALLWRHQATRTTIWRAEVDYWIDQYDQATHPAAAARRAVARQQQRPRSKVGAGRRA